MTVGLLLTSLTLGMRHGVDWDHLAAIADLSSAASSRRRGFMLSLMYAVGHAAVVLVLGALAVVVGARLPDGVDTWSGRVVGVTLVVLGAWILVELARRGRDFRLRSRWILVLSGTFAGLRRVHQARTRRRLSVTHTHTHTHEHQHGHDRPESPADDGHAHQGLDRVHAHDHGHGSRRPSTPEQGPIAAPDLVGAGPVPHEAEMEVSPAVTPSPARSGRGWLAGLSLSHSHRHRHPHHHDLVLADQLGPNQPGNGTAAGIGLLHGIGIESPTQIAVFVASTSVSGTGTGVALLVAWVAGLVIANSVLAVLAGVGLLRAERHFAIYATVAVAVAVLSLAMGALMIAGLDVLPALGP
jgi:cytochrome c biogenesis protein CcdA